MFGRRILLIILFLGSFRFVSGQERVTLQVSGASGPVGYASVYLPEIKTGGLTDSLGNFVVSLTEGNHLIKVSAIGYLTLKKQIEVRGNNPMVKLTLREEPAALNEVTITGTAKEVSRMNSPVPVEIYSASYFRKNPSPGLFESMQMVNGVQPTINCNVCNTGDIHINGMEGPYTMVLIDGMPIVSALSTVYGLSGIPNSMIERVEIVKGPASTLYGSEAVAGLINVITRRPERAPRWYTDAMTTGQGEHLLDLGISRYHNGTGMLLSINAGQQGNKYDRNADNFTDMALYNRFSMFNKWTFTNRLKKESGLAMRYYYEDRFGGEMGFMHALRGSHMVYGESIFTHRFEVIGTYRLPISLPVKFNVSYNFHDQNSYYGITPFNARQQVLFFQSVLENKTHRHDVTSGLTCRYTWYDDNTPATAGADSIHPVNMPSIRWMPGIYLQDEWLVNSRNGLLSGIRMDYFSDHGLIFSPRLAWKFTPDRYNTIRLSSGNGFRVVNLFTEDHQALTGARKVVIRESLRPEQSWNVNLNYTRFIVVGKGFMNLDGGLFYTYFTNRIIADYDTHPEQIIYSNLNGYSVSKGVNIMSETTFGFPFKLTLAATWMKVYKVENDPSGNEIVSQQVHAPEWSGIFQLTYSAMKSKLVVDFGGSWYGPMRLPILPSDFRPAVSPWFCLMNMQLAYQIHPAVQLYGGVKNLLDFMPSDPIMRPFDPFNRQVTINNPKHYTFDTSYNYAPMQGRRIFAGIRFSLF